MTFDNVQLSTTSLLAEATELLEGGQYLQAEPKSDGHWPTKNVRLFEDTYSIVALLVFDTWKELSETWIEAQTALIELMSTHIRSWEAKAWDGYLVLLTPALVDSNEAFKPSQIRYNTNRVRKILATGDDLKELSDVESALLPLLPIQSGLNFVEIQSSLELLPTLLSGYGISEEIVKVVVNSYLGGRSLMQEIDNHRVQHEHR